MASSGFRHQCFIDHGSPSDHIPIVAAVIKHKLKLNHRCLYFNSEQMVAELQSYLAEIGVDIAQETEGTNLVFTSHLLHLSEDQTFEVDRMIAALKETLDQTLRAGYVGLWSSGDIAWEFGPKDDFGQLRAYEMQLEKFLSTHPQMSAVCLYHARVLPPEAMQTGHEVHPSFFLSETQSRSNPAYGVNRQIEPMPSLETVLEVSFPGDILSRASACADTQGITLDEFINQAITEKFYHAAQKHPKNGHPPKFQ
jgi:MEDS: MEthanogen/methylotroph, DcmR Sensory domain